MGSAERGVWSVKFSSSIKFRNPHSELILYVCVSVSKMFDLLNRRGLFL